MAFASGSASHSIAQINITPLVDVMLVLLVIFMIAAPVMTRAIPMDLPQPGPPDVQRLPPAPIVLRIDAAGGLFWNGDATVAAALPGRMRAALLATPGNPPMLQIDASDDADYAAVAQVLAIARNTRMEKVGFIKR